MFAVVPMVGGVSMGVGQHIQFHHGRLAVELDEQTAWRKIALDGAIIWPVGSLSVERLTFQMECEPTMRGHARLQLPPARVFESQGEPPSAIVVADLELSISPTPKLEDLPKESLYDELAAHWRATLSWFSCAWIQPSDRLLSSDVVVRSCLRIDTKIACTEFAFRYRVDPLFLGEEEIVLEDYVRRG